MKQHILIVDDEPPVRELLRAFFKKKGYVVSVAGDGAEAVQVISDGGIGLVVLDVLLGEEDGLELLTQIKAAHPNLPVIIMTGIGFDEELLQEAIQKGASGYVSKTLPLDQVLMEIHRALDYKQSSS